MANPADVWAIHRAEPGDAARLTDLAIRSKAQWGYSEAFMEACRAELTYDAERVRRHPFYVLRTEDTMGGFYGLAATSADALELEALFVAAGRGGRGYGRALVTHARALARALGATRLTVQSDPNAEGFYASVGARPDGQRESGSIAGRMLRTYVLDVTT